MSKKIDAQDEKLATFLAKNDVNAPAAPRGEWRAIEARTMRDTHSARAGARAWWAGIATATALACALFAFWPAALQVQPPRTAPAAVTEKASDEELAEFLGESYEYLDESADENAEPFGF